MAIQMRRGKFGKFAPSKLLPGEWAVVQQGDVSANDGRSVYIAFAAGVVKRMATYEDMVDNAKQAVRDSIASVISEITSKVTKTNDDIEAAEDERDRAESSRASAENARTMAESTRVAAEIARASEESKRAASEADRQMRQKKNDADQALNNERMLSLQPHVCTAGEYDAKTRVPTVENPSDSQLYLVPLSEGDHSSGDGNAYAEWRRIGGRWEQLGVSNARDERITTDEVGRAMSDEGAIGESVLSLTGLSYLARLIRQSITSAVEGRAERSHVHAASDISGGTLSTSRLPTVPISKGGTGSSTAAGARTNIGAASKADLDALKTSLSSAPQVYQNGVLNAEARNGVCRVTVRGIVNGSGHWGITTLATLPVGMRPLSNAYCVILTQDTVQQTKILEIDTTGEAKVISKGASDIWGVWMFATITYLV